MYFIYFIKRLSKAKPSFEILRFDIRYSAVLFSLVLRFAIKTNRWLPKRPVNHQKTGPLPTQPWKISLNFENHLG